MKRQFLTRLMLMLLLACQIPAVAAQAGEAEIDIETETESDAREESDALAPWEGDGKSTAEIRLLNDLVAYIYQSERLYGDVQWALGYFERFDAEKTWENLQLARAGLTIAMDDLSGLRFPETELTLEDQMELMDRGIDVSFMEYNQALFEGDQTAYRNSCINLWYSLTEGAFLQDDWDISMQHVEVLKELIAACIQYLASTADWVLSSLKDDGITERFHSLMERFCPLTRACQEDTLGDNTIETIEARVQELLDHVEELLLDKARILGALDDQLNVYRERIEQGDFQAIGKNLMDISDLPFCVFCPAWYKNEMITYYWQEEGELINTPLPGSDLQRIPDVCQTSISGVTEEEVLAYRDELEKAGLSCIGESDEDGELKVFYEVGESSFVIHWKEESTTILMMENPVCLVPRWYPKALQYKTEAEA